MNIPNFEINLAKKAIEPASDPYLRAFLLHLKAASQSRAGNPTQHSLLSEVIQSTLF
jgi:hypothetical protein